MDIRNLHVIPGFRRSIVLEISWSSVVTHIGKTLRDHEVIFGVLPSQRLPVFGGRMNGTIKCSSYNFSVVADAMNTQSTSGPATSQCDRDICNDAPLVIEFVTFICAGNFTRLVESASSHNTDDLNMYVLLYKLIIFYYKNIQFFIFHFFCQMHVRFPPHIPFVNA